MLTSVLTDFFMAQWIEKGWKKTGLSISILTNLALLFYFKYANFTYENIGIFTQYFGLSDTFKPIAAIALPLGISFYTFQTMSYTIDVYFERTKANKNFIDFAAYVTMFPQLIAGPIVRYQSIKDDLENKKISTANFAAGVERFIIGLFKKMFIANNFAFIADLVFETPTQDLSTGIAWIGAIAYSFQIYYDFSAYSDMAIGLGKMMGFRFPENFNYPYQAKNIRDFWQRWHISLSTWFRDYVYIPLGGSRNGTFKTYRNLTIVFLVTGTWHGANWTFIVWGLFHGFFLIIERVFLLKLLKKTPNFIQIFYTLLVVLFAWVLFRSDSIDQAAFYMNKMLSFSQGDFATVNYLWFYVLNYEMLIVSFLAVVFSFPIYKKVIELKNSFKNPVLIHSFNIVYLSTLFLISIISVSYIATNSYNPFIYFRF